MRVLSRKFHRRAVEERNFGWWNIAVVTACRRKKSSAESHSAITGGWGLMEQVRRLNKSSYRGRREILRDQISSLVSHRFWSGGDTSWFLFVTSPVQSYYLMHSTRANLNTDKLYRENASNSSWAKSAWKVLNKQQKTVLTHVQCRSRP